MYGPEILRDKVLNAVVSVDDEAQGRELTWPIADDFVVELGYANLKVERLQSRHSCADLEVELLSSLHGLSSLPIKLASILTCIVDLVGNDSAESGSLHLDAGIDLATFRDDL